MFEKSLDRHSFLSECCCCCFNHSLVGCRNFGCTEWAAPERLQALLSQVIARWKQGTSRQSALPGSRAKSCPEQGSTVFVGSRLS